LNNNTWSLVALAGVALFLLFLATNRKIDEQAAVVAPPASVEEPAAPPSTDRDTNTIIRDGLGAPRFGE